MTDDVEQVAGQLAIMDQAAGLCSQAARFVATAESWPVFLAWLQAHGFPAATPHDSEAMREAMAAAADLFGQLPGTGAAFATPEHRAELAGWIGSLGQGQQP